MFSCVLSADLFFFLFGIDKENGPKMINEIKLINGGKILENNTTLSEARSIQICEHPGMVTTVHVVLPPPIVGRRDGNFNAFPLDFFCVCLYISEFWFLLFFRETAE